MRSIRRWLESRRDDRPSRRSTARRSRPALESLESRLLLSPATGTAGLTPATITISFVPDGTSLGGATSNLVSAFNANLAGRWQSEILRAAQVWAQRTNINFVVVPDD